jgi:hypothetical protein
MGNFRRIFIVSEFHPWIYGESGISTLFKRPGSDACSRAIEGGGGEGEEEEEEESNLRETIDRHTIRPKLNCEECRWEYCVLHSRLEPL